MFPRGSASNNYTDMSFHAVAATGADGKLYVDKTYAGESLWWMFSSAGRPCF